MTTIRRITTSQIDGNSANENNSNEIRPFGETSFYIDGNNKLVLSMFDGTRTHLRSKVVGPGVLYGSNADSGDGAGLDTIKLIPDALLYSQGSDQYLIVDPTQPNHIHIRAGGTIDNSSADLYLGGENNHVRVNDTGFLTLKAANAVDLNVGTSIYTFSYDQMVGSSFLIPGGIQGALQPSFLSSNGLGITIDGFNTPNTVDIGNISSSTVLRLKDGVGAGNIVVEALGTSLKLQTNNNSTWEFNDNGNLTLPNNGVIRADGTNVEVGNVSNFNVEANAVVNIFTDAQGAAHQWQFGDAGEIIFPDTTVQTTGYQKVAVPTTSLGQSGDQVGMIAHDANYHYYCKENYVAPVIYTYIGVEALPPGTTDPFVWTNQQFGTNTYWIPYFSTFNTSNPVPQAGWNVVINGQNLIIDSVIENLSGFGMTYTINFAAPITNGNDMSYTANPGSGNIWVRTAWSADTW